ncbi:MAG: hypothetical protein OWU32_12900 [Firmicutes bacterium]|nr:hypothetical protein [Bacillota bacterium]
MGAQNDAWRLLDMVAVIPTYDNSGYATRVVLADGTSVLTGLKPRAIMRTALLMEGIAWKGYVARYRTKRSGAQTIPVVHPPHAFMTAQMCKAKVQGDGLYGYVRLDKIEELRNILGATGRKGEIRLFSGEVVTTSQKFVTVQDHFDRAAGELVQAISRQRFERMTLREQRRTDVRLRQERFESEERMARQDRRDLAEKMESLTELGVD